MSDSSDTETMPLPLPGSPGSSWAGFRERFKALFRDADPRVCAAFWCFGMPALITSCFGRVTGCYEKLGLYANSLRHCE
jgi:hypothetical protein